MAGVGAFAIALGVVGIFMIVTQLLPGRDKATGTVVTRPRTSLRLRLRFPLTGRRRWLAVGGLVAGAGMWFASGWVVFLLGVPLAVMLLPVLFASGGATERLARLDALELWTRSLAGLTVAGAGLEQTIASSVSSAGDAIRVPVTDLVARINARWRTSEALRAFANDIEDPTCDLIVMHLLLAERMRGPGLARALDDLADSISEEIRARRAIETDRAKPRQNTRIITVTTLLLLCAMPFTGTFMAPYAAASGQVLLAVWLFLYALTLMWLRRIAEPARSPRTLSDPRRS